MVLRMFKRSNLFPMCLFFLLFQVYLFHYQLKKNSGYMKESSALNAHTRPNTPVGTAKKQLPSYSINDIAHSVGWVKQTAGLESDFLCVKATNFQSDLFKEPCRLDGVTIVMITEGEVQANINLQQLNMQAGEVIVNMPDNIVQILQDGSNVSGIVMLVSYGMYQKLSALHIEKTPTHTYLQKHPVFRPKDKDWKWLLEFADYVYYVANEYDGERKIEIIQGLLLAFSQSLLDAANRADFIQTSSIVLNANTHQTNIFEQFMALLQEYHTQERTVQFYAEKLLFTPKYLSRLIQDITQRSATDWITDFVMLEARHLLRKPDLSIKEVAYQLNFATPSLFARYFKKHAQCTPLEYRNGMGL